MTPVDDLKPGMWVAVVAKRQEEAPGYDDWPMFSQPKSQVFDGFPLRVLAISLPFMAVQRGNQIQSIDLRKFSVQKLTRSYVESASEFMPEIKGKMKSKRRRKQKPDPRACLRCGAKVIQRRVISPDPARQAWFNACSECGFDQGPVPNG